MHLKTLRMRGFKSFAQSVELHFEHGIAVVVGPNGSGKSNIADALQWAMAVQSPAPAARPHRSGRAVRRAPTRGRAAGVCEVELVLDNECATLPIEFNEVSVMRRLYRDGESEYFINRARVRRLDVLELLSDTGLGREMHSVIGQGRVEEILLAKPHERRRFVEEAAGLGKYQRRRTRAEAKLARVEARAGARPRPRARGARPAAAAVDAGDRRRAGRQAGRRDRAAGGWRCSRRSWWASGRGSTSCARRLGERRRPPGPRSTQAAAGAGRRAARPPSRSWPGWLGHRSARPAPSTRSRPPATGWRRSAAADWTAAIAQLERAARRGAGSTPRQLRREAEQAGGGGGVGRGCRRRRT